MPSDPLQVAPAIATEFCLSDSNFGLFKILEKATQVVRGKPILSLIKD